jgi:hypothetical protein
MAKSSTTFQKGDGRQRKPVGAINKTTKMVKEVFAEVFNDLQLDKKANLRAWGKENPTEFYKLASKLIPLQLTGDPDNPLVQEMKVIVVKTDAPISKSEEEVQ